MLITTLVHNYLRSAISQSEGIYASINELVTLENSYTSIDSEDIEAQETAYNELKQLYSDKQEQFQRFFDNMMSLTWLSFICLFFGFQYLADIAYTAMTNKSFNVHNSKNYLDAWIFLIFLVNIFICFVRLLSQQIGEGPGVVTWNEMAPVYCRNYVENYANEHTLLIIGVVSLWIRAI